MDDGMEAWERETVRHFRELDRDEAIRRIRARLEDLDSRRETLSQDEEFDRWDLRFHQAIIETGQTPDEREYLFYQYLADHPERGNKRIEARVRELAAALGIDPGFVERLEDLPAGHLFVRYRVRLQELMDTY